MLRRFLKLTANDGIVVMYNNQGYEVAEDVKNVRKIIATTDTSLEIVSKGINPVYEKLPQPSQQFIEKYIDSYNKGEIITDVLVEYEEMAGEELGVDPAYYPLEERLKLKINPKDNTINIKITKESWNREEVRQLLIDCCGEVSCEDGTFLGKEPADLYEWIKQNLKL